MKKAFGQTVREIKREMNKKVLKVPGIEQKVLDATSNEPWGPHGSLLADIAQATRNYHEYQMIMTVIWKRINDTGKNWRHVYKALTVLEFLVAHGSERVIDEIREHAYQISTLSDFQYVDSSGRDQGSNVRKKSQSLVVLVNDKERIQEVRQKAAANRDKFRSTSLAGGMYRPGSYSSAGGYGDRYDDDRYEGRYGSRDDDRNGNGRERESGYGDDDRYGRYGDSYGRDGDRYGRDSEDYHGRSQSIDEDQYGSRSRSSDRDKDRSYEEDGQYSSRGSGAKIDDARDGRHLEQKSSEQNLGGPPSYEEAVGDTHSTINNQRDGETSNASPKVSPPVSVNPNQVNATPGTSAAPVPAAAANKEVDGFDEFDPRRSFPAASTTPNAAETDLLGSLSESFSSNALALVPATFATSEADASANSVSGPAFIATPSAAAVTNLPLEDPFGEGPFKAIPSTDSFPVQSQTAGVISSHHPSTNQISGPPQPVAQKVETINDFADTFPGISYTSSSVQIPSTNSQFSPQEMTPIDQNIDILADILPPGYSPPTTSQASFAAPSGQPASQSVFIAPTGQPAPPSGLPAPTGHPASLLGFPAPNGLPSSLSGFPAQSGQPLSLTNFPPQGGQPASQTGFLPHTAGPVPQSGFPPQSSQPAFQTGFPSQIGTGPQAGFLSSNGQATQPSTSLYGGFPQSVSTAPVAPQMASQIPTGPTAQLDTANILPPSSFASPVAQTPQTPVASQPALTASTGSLAIVPQPAKEKFEPKSAVWADTLSRGLVNLNISGPKTNPLADIGIDFEAINRKEKRMEKPSTAPAISTVTMGKAMGSGSGIGRAGAGALRGPPNPIIGSGMGMGMGMGGGPGVGMGMGGGPSVGTSMGGYVGMNQPMGMGIGMNRPMNMGMGMNMGIGQGVQMQPPTGFPPGSAMPGGYNPMMGAGGHVQQPYSGGYR